MDADAGSADQAASHPFTCNSCRVAFRSSDSQRAHMQTDWHRYNLKRKVAALPPLSSEVFSDKVQANKADEVASAAKAAYERTCSICSKTYASVNSYENHLSSQRHRQNEARAARQEQRQDRDKPAADKPTEDKPTGDKTTEEKDEKTDDPTDPLTTCLFCNILIGDLEKNVVHMKERHGMFIPEQKYLVDRPGLIRYLHAKIQEGNECLLCGTQKRTAEACQSHMLDKRHCMIAYTSEEDQLEIGDYYDFRTTYSDAGDDDEDWEDEDEEADAKSAASWETTSAGSDEIGPLYEDNYHTRLPLSHHHNLNDPRPHKTPEGFHSHAHPAGRAVYYDDVELHLPSGLAVGHRKHRTIWRQRLVRKSEPVVVDGDYTDTDDESEDKPASGTAVATTEGQTAGQLSRRERRDELFHRSANVDPRNRQLITQTDEMGIQGITGQDRKVLIESVKRNQRATHQIQNNNRAAYERKGNMQKHFRDPLLQ